MGFILKKIAGALLMPLPALLILGIAGWILWARGRWKRTGQGMVAASLLLLSLVALTPVADALIRPLERAAPAFPGDSVGFVVVLASGHTSDPALPPRARLSSAALVRLVEGVSIATSQPWSRLVLSGWGGADPKPNAEVYRETAAALGFPEARMVLEPRPRDTRQEAELLAPLLRGHPFALVTSASHMPRALALFRAQGLDPVPAPTGHLSKEQRAFDMLELVPDENALALARLAWHEILGRLWARLTDGA
ncbi:MAG: envelope biogenesis factor ElyC [Gemmatimonadetes bacterium]|nr:envelope biogenesis factor ElyC [Gemmatimonadota bacterium]